MRAQFETLHSRVSVVADYVADVLRGRVLVHNELVEVPILGDW